MRVMGEADAHKLRPLEEQPRLERTAPRDEARGRRRARRACELRGRAEEGEGVRARASRAEGGGEEARGREDREEEADEGAP